MKSFCLWHKRFLYLGVQTEFKAQEIASSTGLFFWEVNCRGSKEIENLIESRTKHLKHLLTQLVCNRSHWWLLGQGIIIDSLKLWGTQHSSSDMLNRSVSTEQSCLRHSPATQGGSLSGPADFLTLVLYKTLQTSFGMKTYCMSQYLKHFDDRGTGPGLWEWDNL